MLAIACERANVRAGVLAGIEQAFSMEETAECSDTATGSLTELWGLMALAGWRPVTVAGLPLLNVQCSGYTECLRVVATASGPMSGRVRCKSPQQERPRRARVLMIVARQWLAPSGAFTARTCVGLVPGAVGPADCGSPL
jgi:hypothetical protein